LINVNVRIPSRQQELLVMLEALVKLNRLQRRRNPRLPALYQSGVRYRREARDPRTGNRKEHWRTFGEMMEARSGDCEDMVAARVSELREKGINAKPWLKKVSPRMWHVLVRWPDGRIEDPSKRLGMKAAA
jgi:hypothetical protein